MALNACGTCPHVLRGLEVLQDHRGALRFVVQQIQAGGGHARRRPFGRVDAGDKRFDPFGAHVGESDGTNVHYGGLLTRWDFDHTRPRCRPLRARRGRARGRSHCASRHSARTGAMDDLDAG